MRLFRQDDPGLVGYGYWREFHRAISFHSRSRAGIQRRGVDPSVSVAAGKILCMSSVHQEIPWAGHANYAASKGGVMLLIKSLAQEMAPYRIESTALHRVRFERQSTPSH